MLITIISDFWEDDKGITRVLEEFKVTDQEKDEIRNRIAAEDPENRLVVLEMLDKR